MTVIKKIKTIPSHANIKQGAEDINKITLVKLLLFFNFILYVFALRERRKERDQLIFLKKHYFKRSSV